RDRRSVLLAAGDIPGSVRSAQAVAVVTLEAPDPDQPIGRSGGVSIEPDLGAEHRGLAADRLICARWFPGVFDSPEGELVDRRPEVSPGIRQPVPDLVAGLGRLALDHAGRLERAEAVGEPGRG